MLAILLSLGVLASWPVELRAQLVTATALLDASSEGVPHPSTHPSVPTFSRNAARSTGTVRGTVRDSVTHAPVVGATIAVNGAQPRAVTGADGTYRLASVPVGPVTLTVRRLGYVPVSRQVLVTADGETVVDVQLVAAPQMLDEVVTTGTVVPTAVKALPTPITVISARDIADQPAPRLTELFRQAVPGAIAPDASVFTMQTPMSVRGAASLLGASGTMKVYIDGIEVASKSLAGVDPSSVDRIEVIRGPEAAAIYGSDAIGGVMQIFTKRGDGNLFHPDLDGQITLGTTQNPYEDRSALRQEYAVSIQGASATSSYSVGSSYTHEGDWLPNYSQSSPAVYGGVRITRDRFTADLSARYISVSLGRPLDPRTPKTGYAPFTKPYYYESSQPTATYGVHLTYAPRSWWQHSLTVGVDGYSYDEHSTQPRLTTPSDTLLYVTFQNAHKNSIAYNTSVTVPLAASLSAMLTAGVDHYDFTNDVASTTGATKISGTITTAPGNPLTGTRNITTNTGYFAQGQFNFHDALFLTAGVRAEQNSNFGNDIGTPLSPRVGISYVHQLGATAIKFRASYGKAISPPQPGLKSQLSLGFRTQSANPLLGPERQEGGDAGVDLVFGPRGSLGITGYDQTASGLIETVLVDPASNPPTYQNQNVGRVRNRGLEIEGALHWRAVDVTGQYALSNSRVRAIGPGYTGPLQVGDQSLLVPRNTAGASITVRPFRRATVETWLNYVGARRQLDFLREFSCFGHTGPCAASIRDYLTTYPSFVQTSLSVRYQVTVHVTTFFSVQNVGNQIHDQFGNTTPEAGRITLIGARIRTGL